MPVALSPSLPGDFDIVNCTQPRHTFRQAYPNCNIDDGEYKCRDGSSPEVHYKVISGVVGAASSVTSIQVANLLRLFRIPQPVSVFGSKLLTELLQGWSRGRSGLVQG
ncbi:hypothetical protein O3P69_019017 [Scylla paramamosain]|uniref:Uncharacterized protein n=1 Tax=Scylla paramamosain TaxID=85552 RepID=A0AAW0T7E4_SCYPA